MNTLKNRKVLDCFTFYNEFDLLDVRFEELKDSVDYFVLIESNLTFAGKPKEFLFDKVKEKYSHLPIVHVKVEDMPTGQNYQNNWDREFWQRNAIDRGIQQVELTDDDLIFINDVDEIWDPSILDRGIEFNHDEIYSTIMDFYYYNPTLRFKDHRHTLGNMVTYGFYKKHRDPNNIRWLRIPGVKNRIIRLAGWHFSFFGDIDFIVNKIKSFSHQEYNQEKYLSHEYIKSMIENGDELFQQKLHGKPIEIEKVELEDNDYLPKSIDLIKQKFL